MIRQTITPGTRLPASRIASAIQAQQIKFASFFYQLLYFSYYRFLYGKRFILAGRLAEAIAALEQRQARGDVVADRDKWESQYLQGRWSRLRDIEQAPRYGVIGAYLQFSKPGARVLDIGCGEGVLLEYLNPALYSNYVGIDLSQAAIDRALARGFVRSTFAQADALGYVPAEGYDVIVFNEVLYYFPNPFEVLKRYQRWLNPGGVFIASLFAGSARTSAIARWLKNNYASVKETKITSHSKRWIINVFVPPIANATERS
jgi:2-polyprenyl-3-methyl-5-hydroxy-6-metoxy-1,4-benzoquinol methylase